MNLDTYGSLLEFKENYKVIYFGYYQEKYADLDFITYLHELKIIYSSLSLERARGINLSKYENPIEGETEEERQFKDQIMQFNKKMYLEYCEILNFIYETITIKEGEKKEQENRGSFIAHMQENRDVLPETTLVDIHLLKYFSENFNPTDIRFNDLTKYNHIYRYFNSNLEYNIEHRAYKNLIKDLFGFDYGRSEIKGETQKHMNRLKIIASNYHNLRK